MYFYHKKIIFCSLYLVERSIFTTFAPASENKGQQSGCSAVGSVPGLGPGGRPFESGRPDN